LAKLFVDDCHAIYPVNLKLERERERYGRQKKDQNNIEERSAALANYTALDKNVMSCISNVNVLHRNAMPKSNFTLLYCDSTSILKI
jgi:hypothetical protein